MFRHFGLSVPFDKGSCVFLRVIFLPCGSVHTVFSWRVRAVMASVLHLRLHVLKTSLLAIGGQCPHQHSRSPILWQLIHNFFAGRTNKFSSLLVWGVTGRTSNRIHSCLFVIRVSWNASIGKQGIPRRVTTQTRRFQPHYGPSRRLTRACECPA